MELPFAVESSSSPALPQQQPQHVPNNQLHLSAHSSSGNSSLVTASSQESVEASIPTHSFDSSPPTTASISSSTATAGPTIRHAPIQHHAATAFHPALTPTNMSSSSISRTSTSMPQRKNQQQLPPQPQHPTTSAASASATLKAGSRMVTSMLSHFGSLGVSNPLSYSSTTDPSRQVEQETVDFTYVNVCETDEDEVDIILAGAEEDDHDASDKPSERGGNVLGVLLNRPGGDGVVNYCAQAHDAATAAADAKKRGNLQDALDQHATAARLFRQAAVAVRDGHSSGSSSMVNSLLLLSQTHSKYALGIQRVAKVRPSLMKRDDASQNDRLRATVRGALDHNTEADMADSAFLGNATHSPTVSSPPRAAHDASSADKHNPVDEMMELERELRNMDMALELGNSIASLDARTQNRMRSSPNNIDGSFMVVPPGSQSYMSSSTLWSAPSTPTASGPTTPTRPKSGRSRPNRVQNILEASSTTTRPGPVIAPPKTLGGGGGLESSWWGNTSVVASQVLTSSVISVASNGSGGAGGDIIPGANNTKQLMRLMDALKTLGDENAALLREVEDAEAARREAKASKEQMRHFKEEYGKRFAALKEALEKFRKGYPGDVVGDSVNPVTSSDFMKTASTTEQLQRQEQLIRKLTGDLKKEKEDSKRKDATLKKYESFYKEVKARSAQKAKQRQKEEQKRLQQSRGKLRGSP